MHNAVTSGWAKLGGRWLNVSAVASPRCSKTSPWGLDTREGFFKPTRAGRPSYVRCGPKGLGNLAQASYLLSPERLSIGLQGKK
jgi:hypothetical protein